ncbi:hypothetical protein LCGC14_2056600 [marine sediment metagenome]|uniref:Uncharacterized protein n=1 Tax=marine sediment metagenome TaxID=412755 RepID=A0A0F9HJH1_9ZZZZ
MTAECSHHFVIETANGPMSRGVCKKCGAIQDFKNSVTEQTWMETRNTLYTGPVADSVFPHKREGEE